MVQIAITKQFTHRSEWLVMTCKRCKIAVRPVDLGLDVGRGEKIDSLKRPVGPASYLSYSRLPIILLGCSFYT